MQSGGLEVGSERGIRAIMSYHEAGHAVVARALGVEVIAAISMDYPDADTAAAVPTASALHRSRGADTATQIRAAEADAMVALAGAIAQKRAPIRHPDVGHDVDMANANNAVMCAALLAAGKPIPEGPTPIAIEKWIIVDAQERYRRLTSATEKVVAARWAAIGRVAAALQDRDRIDQTELDRLIAGA
jgi:hypothetical protein